MALEKGTRHVSLMGNELSRARRTHGLGEGVAAEEVFAARNRPPA